MNTQNTTSKCNSTRYACLWRLNLKHYILLLFVISFSGSLFSNDSNIKESSDLMAFAPQIRAIKKVENTENLENGNIVITYKIGIKNKGTTDLTNLDLNFDIATQLGNAYIGLSAASPNISIFSSTATSSPEINASFNGDSDINLFQDNVFDLLAIDEEVFVLLSIEVNPYQVSWPIQTQVNAKAESQSLDNNAIQTEDLSDSGTSFFGNNPDAPGDTGTQNDPTALTCFVANLMIDTPDNVCPGASVEAAISSAINDVAYEWTLTGSSEILSNSATPILPGIDTLTTFEVRAINNTEICFYDMTSQVDVGLFEVPAVNPEIVLSIGENCAPSTVEFVANQEPGDTTVLSYFWSGGNYGWVSIDPDPMIVNAHSYYNGVYTLMATDANGCTGTGDVELSGAFLYTEPGGQNGIVSLNPTGTDCENLSDQGFSITAPNYQLEGETVVYEWSTPNGVISNISGLGTNEIIVNPVDLSVHQGDYSVVITAGDCVYSSDTFNLEVFDQVGLPEVLIDNSAPFCEGGMFTLLANITNANSYEWTGPDGFNSVSQNPVVSNVSSANNGLYTLTATSIDGCSVTTSLVVDEIGEIPVTPTINGNNVVCENEMIILSANEIYTGSVDYTWINGAGVTVGNSAELNLDPMDPNAVSPYQLEVHLNGCSSSLSAAFEVINVALPTVEISVSTGGNIACAETEFQLNASDIPGGIYEWRVQGNPTIISTEQNPFFTTGVSNVIYELSVYYPECSTIITGSIELDIQPIIAFTVSTDFEVDGNCLPTQLFLTGEITSGNENSLTYEWEGPNGFFSSESNPVISDLSVANNGLYSLIISNASGCSTKNSFQINNAFDPIPIPVITSNAPGACEGTAFALSIQQYSGASVSYNWTVPSSAAGTITGLNTNIISIPALDGLTHNGDYSVSVIVDGCVLEAEVFNLAIDLLPSVVPEVANNSTVCEGGVLSLLANASNANEFNWSGPNGFSSTAENPTIPNATVMDNGQYILAATSAAGCLATANLTVEGIGLTPVTPSINGTQSVCENGNILLTLNESYSEPVDYSWTNGAGTIVGNTEELNLPASDLNAISPYQLAIILGDCSSNLSSAFNVTTTALPVLTITSSTGNNTACEGQSIQLNTIDIPGGIYSWNVQGNPTVISTQQNPVFTPDASNVTYELSVFYPECSTTLTASIAIEVQTAFDITTATDYNLDGNCIPTELSLSSEVIPNGGSGLNYEWSGPNGFFSTASNPVITNLSTANNGNYSLTVSTMSGCSGSSSFNINNAFVPLDIPVITSNVPGACEGNSFALFIQQYSGSSVSYNWTIPSSAAGTITGLNTNIISISALDGLIHNGDYSVSVIVDGCVLDAEVFNLEVDVLPSVAPAVSSNSATCEGDVLSLLANANNVDNFNWSGPNGFNSTAENPTIPNASVMNNGQYVLAATSAAGCFTTANVMVEGIGLTPVTPTITGTVSICENGTLLLTPNESYSDPVDYNWINGLGTIVGNTAELSLSASAPNAISPYQLEIILGDCSSGLSTAFDVATTSLPLLTVTNSSNNNIACEGQSIQLNATDIPGGIYSWNVRGNPTIISTQQNPVFTPDASNVIYELSVFYPECSSTLTASIDIEVQTALEITTVADYSLDGNCVPTDLFLSGAIIPNGGTGLSYEWIGPDGFFSTESNPVINNLSDANNGTYILTISNADGCTGNSSLDILNSFEGIPTPMITSNAISPCAGQSIVLSVPEYSGANVSYFWNIPSNASGTVTGINSNELSIATLDENIHNGNYSISIEVDGCTILSNNYNLESFVLPSINPSVSNNSIICEGESLILMANATGANSFFWTGPNGFSSTDENPVIDNTNVLNNGLYTLSVLGAGACSVEQSVMVQTVNVTPAVPVIFSTSTTVCEGDLFDLRTTNNYLPGSVSFEWTNGNGVFIGSSETLTLLAGSALAIPPFDLTVTAGDCSITANASLLVEIILSPSISVQSVEAICAGEDVQLFSSSVFGGNYEWRIAGSSTIISDIQNPVFSQLLETTIFELSVSSNGCIWNSETVEVLVNKNPDAVPTLSYALNPDCSPADLTLLANPVPGAGTDLSFLWTGPNGFSSVLENPVIENAQSNNNGDYNLLVTNEEGCFSNSSIEINQVIDVPVQPFLTNLTPLCNQSEIILNIPEYTGSSVNYIWNIPTTTNVSGLNGHEITISNADPDVHNGNYQVTVFVDDCILTSNLFNLDIAEESVLSIAIANQGYICEGETIQFDVSTIGTTSYSWNGPMGFSSNQAEPVIGNVGVSNNGNYTLVASNAAGCSVTETITVNTIIGQPQTPILSSAGFFCENENIEINVLQSYLGDNVSYNWYNGSGNLISNAFTLSIDSNDPLAITPFYLVITVDGCPSDPSNSIDVQISDEPIAIADNNGPVCYGETVVLSTSNVGNVNYLWYDNHPTASSPPANLIATGQSPLIDDLQVGFHTFYLLIENENACVSETPAETTVEVIAQPILSDIIGEGVYCEGETVTLSTNTAVPYTGIIQYTWMNEATGFTFTGVSIDGGNFSMTIPSFDESFEGTYTLQLGINDECIIAPASVIIQLAGSSDAPHLSVNEHIFCTGQDLILTASSFLGVESYEWFFTNSSGTISLGTSIFPSWVINEVGLAQSGVYAVNAIIDGCSSALSNTEEVQVTDEIEIPEIFNTTSALNPACVHDMVNLSVEIDPGATYYWYGPNGLIVNGFGLVLMDVSIEEAGAYYVVAEIAGCASVVSEETIVYINETPGTPILAAENPVCEGGDIKLFIENPILVPPGSNPEFEWYFQNTANPSIITSDPELIIPNASILDQGNYFVAIRLGECISPFSNVVNIEVISTPNEIANAGDDQEACAGEVLSLQAELPTIGTGIWSSPTGATVANATDNSSAISNLEPGENIFVWSLAVNGCDPFDADTVIVLINDIEAEIAFAGEDIKYCEETNFNLNAAPAPNANGNWTQPQSQVLAGVEIVNPELSNSAITGLQAGNSYAFYWTIYDPVCGFYSNDEVLVTLSEIPANNALIPEDTLYACGEETLTLTALAPDVGTGFWTTNSSASIANPGTAVALVDEIESGTSEFVWSISFDACENYDSDTLTVINEANLTANPDAYLIGFRESITGEDLLGNDDFADVVAWNFSVIEEPAFGVLSNNITEGVLDYTPNDGFYGEDIFVYELCNANCSSDCDTAKVTIQIAIDEEEDCWVPDVITPNGDGLNDQLEIPCLINFPENKLSIFNRWGDMVFETLAYENDWKGTYRNEPLPPGTYYFFLQLSPDSKVIQGFLTLVR